MQNLLGNNFFFLKNVCIINRELFKKSTHFSKKPAVFELLEDHEEYAVYEHNPDEANWNVFYKTLPPVSDFSFFFSIKTNRINQYT